MPYIHHYASPLGPILLAADHMGLTGLWFEGQKYFPHCSSWIEADLPVFHGAVRWLDCYFSGGRPDGSVPLHLSGTPFQREVWDLLLTIPYGQTTTYGALARTLAARRGVDHFSPQAVGGAVGRNPVSILVPCHRVVGANGSLTGYAGGIQRKIALLTLEGAEFQ